jgi:hypothetical protein
LPGLQSHLVHPNHNYAPTIHKFIIIMTSSIIPEESAAQDVEASANTGDISRNNRKLSTISKMYDIRGDGELDEAELAAWTPQDVGISRMKRCTS